MECSDFSRKDALLSGCAGLLGRLRARRANGNEASRVWGTTE